MNRICNRSAAEAFSAALEALPSTLRDRVGCDLFCGADPIFVGLHHYEDCEDGRSYRDVSHCCYEFHTPDSRITVVLGKQASIATAIHELGHVCDASLKFDTSLLPLCDYAARNRYEAFAMAFEAYFTPPNHSRFWTEGINPEALRALDPAGAALMEALAAA